MSVKRFRDVAEMPAPSGRASYARIKELWKFSERLVPPLFRPGVQRFRSIEESQVDRERATIERMRAMREARQSTRQSSD